MPTTPAFGRRGASPAAGPAPRAPQAAPPREVEGFDLRSFLFSFDGRISRLWYWLGHLGLFMAAEGFSQIIRLLVTTMKPSVGHGASPAFALGAVALMLVLFVAMMAVLVLFFWASLAITVKRWHDRDRSWVWILLGFLPIIGWAWQGIECGFLEGTLGPNRYGPSPKGIEGVVYAGA